MKRRVGTDGSLLPSLPWTLAAVAFALLPHLPYLAPWIGVAFVVCAGGRWLIELRRWRLPPPWLRVALALACFTGVLASYESVSGVGPGSALLAVMAALKLMETRQRRDQFVLLFIAIFLVMASLLREQYLWSLPYLLLALLVTMSAWLQMTARGGSGIGESVRVSARLLLYGTPLMLAMWLFFPRIATPFWAVPIDTGAAGSGLSDTMSPGDISQLSLSDEVAFRVQFDGPIPAPRDRYWRGLVLYIFNGRSWRAIEPTPRDNGARDRIDGSLPPLGYTVTLEATNQPYVFTLDMPLDVTLDKTYMGPQQQVVRTQPIDQRTVYAGRSFVDYRVRGEMTQAHAWYRRLPRNGNERSRALAEAMYAEAGSAEAFIDAVLTRFNREQYFYTLEPPLLGADAVDDFLFETRRGFCEHYASAFAVLMRAAGIPARVVLGYQGGELNPLGNHLVVRQSDAHAWTEVWLEDRGWVRVDPTSAVAPERIELGMSGARFDGIGARWGLAAPAAWMHRLTMTWDALNARWNDWVLGYGPENQDRFMNWLGMDDPSWRKLLLTLVGTLMALLALISLLLLRRYRPPRPDAAARLYARFTRRARLAPQRGETPLAYAARLATHDAARAADAERVTRHYLAARYGNGGATEVEALARAVERYGAAG